MKKQILSMLGLVLFALGFSMLFPMLIGFIDGDSQSSEFALLSTTGMVAGMLLNKKLPVDSEIQIESAYLLVALSWLVAVFFGAIPYIMLDTVPTFSQAIFESVSGFTTTGATIFSDVESLPRSILLWRSMTQWLGGMGIIVLFVALMEFYGSSGLKMFKAETTGPIKEKVVPRMKETAKILWVIYLLLTSFQILVLRILGMPFFDAVCHTFATVATGGFSIKNNSYAFYDSAAIQWTATLFTVMAGTSFSLYFQAFKHKSIKDFWNNVEFRVYIGIISAASLACTAVLVKHGQTLKEALLAGFFHVSTIMTTTGFMTQDFAQWPAILQCILILTMFIGGSAGSTSGGLKVGRIMILWQSVKTQFKKALHPQAVVSIKVAGRTVNQDTLLNTLNFFFIYIVLISFGTFVLTLLDLDILTAFSASLSAVSNVGPALGTLGPTQNYAGLPGIGLNTLSFLMLAGRLELYTILILLTRDFWQEL